MFSLIQLGEDDTTRDEKIDSDKASLNNLLEDIDKEMGDIFVVIFGCIHVQTVCVCVCVCRRD